MARKVDDAPRRAAFALHGLTCAFAMALTAPSPVAGQTPFRINPFISADVLYTNNVDLRPNEARESDFVLTLRPGFDVNYAAPRALLRGSVVVPIVLYAEKNDRNQVYPQVDLLGRYEVVQKFFFVEASANVSQTYFDPFDARPVDLVNETTNRYTASTYRVSPYIDGRSGNFHYVLRDDNSWSRVDRAPVDDSFYTNELFGLIEYEPVQFGGAVEAKRTEISFTGDEHSQILEVARARVTWRPDPQLEGFLIGGYERNRFVNSSVDGSIYGAGVRWRPTPRTVVDGLYERRFFGSAYRADFSHRFPLISISVNAYRDLSSYPQELIRLQNGTFVPDILDQILLSRFPDPQQRSLFIQNYINANGLPLTATGPLSLFSRQVYIQQSATATLGLLGVRNSVFVTAFRSSSEPIAGEDELGLASVLVNKTRQYGVTATWSWRLSSSSTFNLTGTASRSETDGPPVNRSDDRGISATWTRPLSPRTTVHAGVRYWKQDREIADGYSEVAAFAGVRYGFR